MALATVYELRTFADIYTAVIEELKIQSTDTTAINRIKRDINIIYQDEVIPKQEWAWLRGKAALQAPAYINSGTASVTQNSAEVTLTTALSSTIDTGAMWYFSVDGYSEIYRVLIGTSGSSTIVLETPYTGSTSATSSYRLWTDRVMLPSECRETLLVQHDFSDTPLENCGLQTFRKYVTSYPFAEARPSAYTDGEWADPAGWASIAATITTRSSSGLVRSITFNNDITGILRAGYKFKIYLGTGSPAAYNGFFEVGSITGTTVVNYTAATTYDETSTAVSGATFKLFTPTSISQRTRALTYFPSRYSQATTLHVDYLRDVTPLSNDTDEPLMPYTDRVVLLYGALARAWARERDPDESKKNFELFERTLARMEGKMEDSIEFPVIQISKAYLARKREGSRMIDRWKTLYNNFDVD